MKMSSLVDSTYRGLVSRFQRGGTAVKPVSRPGATGYRWGFNVFTPNQKPEIYLLVEVGLLTRNVYKNDIVEIVVSGLTGTVGAQSFVSPTGNCPPLDMIEAFVRQALATKKDNPAVPVLTVTRSVKSEPVQAPPAPEPLPQPPPQPEPEVQPRHKRRGRRQEPEDQPEITAPVAE